MNKCFLGAVVGLTISLMTKTASADLNFKSLGKEDTCEAPDHSWRVECKFPPEGQNRLCLINHSKEQELWTFVRSVGVWWTPESKFLIVDDYLLRDMNAILVFRIDHGGGALIYQTPYSDSVLNKFYATNFDSKTMTLTVKCAAGSGGISYTKNIGLRELPQISQTVYPQTFLNAK